MTTADGQPVLDRIDTPIERRARLFALLRTMQAAGAKCTRICDVDAKVNRGEAGLFLKHDVHGLRLDALIDFAGAERDAGLIGSYFFMAPDHPLTMSHYDRNEQATAMREIQSLGHEVGIHIDPWFLLHLHAGESLGSIMRHLIAEFRAAGIDIRSGNTHGNSRFKTPDRNGFGTSFDLFEEITRQPDYPELADVDAGTAMKIRDQRCSLRALGIEFWADMPMWSANHGIVVTNFVSDNWLGKRGTVEVLVHDDAIGRFTLADRQPPGSRTPAEARELVSIGLTAGGSSPKAGQRHHPLQSDALFGDLQSLATHPTLMLIHPEFYCE